MKTQVFFLDFYKVLSSSIFKVNVDRNRLHKSNNSKVNGDVKILDVKKKKQTKRSQIKK